VTDSTLLIKFAPSLYRYSHTLIVSWSLDIGSVWISSGSMGFQGIAALLYLLMAVYFIAFVTLDLLAMAVQLCY